MIVVERAEKKKSSSGSTEEALLLLVTSMDQFTSSWPLFTPILTLLLPIFTGSSVVPP